VPGPERPALLAVRGRDAALGTVVVVLTVGVFAAVGDHGTLTSISHRRRSGHRISATGRRRAWWALAAVAFSILMGLSRAYLGAHWLSDAVAGILLGISCAVVTALMIGQIQRRVEGRQGAAWK
jgi:membrane-associated phospholipid phosphatase